MSDTVCVSDAAPSPEVAGVDETTSAAWAAVGALTLCVFGLVTAEFLPASILTPIARDLGVSVGTAGQAVTATALVAAVAGPAVVIGGGALDRRKVVLGLTALLLASNLIAAAASNIWMLIAARAALGVALGGIWSLAAALALRLVGARELPRAMSIIFSGVSAATVCAAPLGAYLGELWGWRMTFLAAGGLGALALAALLFTLPKLPAQAAPDLGTFLRLLRRPRIRLVLITVILAISGHFAGFTYVRPFLEQMAGLDVPTLSLVLLAFGAAGFVGNLAGGVAAGRSPAVAIASGALLLAASAFALLAFGVSAGVAFAATTLWGFAFGMLPVTTQTWNTNAAPDHAETAGALLVTTFQIAIATGAVLGGLFFDLLGPSGALGYCALAALAGGIVMLAAGRRPA